MPESAIIGRFRIQRLSIAVIIVISTAIGAAALAVLLYQQLKSEIAKPRENYQWAAYQLQAEYLKLSLTAEQAHTGSMPAEDIDRRYDIFVSRILTLRHGPAYQPIQQTPGFETLLADLLASVRRIDVTLETTANQAGLRADIIMQELTRFAVPLQRLALEIVRDVAVEQTRHQLSLLDAMSYLLVALILIVGIGGVLAMVSIKQLSALHAGRQNLSKALARAEESNRAKSQFLASMSHEMRTPLNAMTGLLREIGYRTRNPSIRGMADSATTSADMLCTLVDDVIDATRLESGKFRFNETAFLPGALFEEVVTMMTSPARDRGNIIVLETENLIDSAIIGDRGRLKQILVNLLSNAVKFTGNGTIRLHASMQNGRGSAAELIVDVQDNGIGIPEDQQERIFERFAQVPGSEGQGLGIGLSITRALVERMKGEISLSSTPGDGSTFTLRLPVVISDVVVPRERHHFSEPLLRGLRILVAEDNATNRQVISMILSRHEAIFDFARNGQEAVDQAQPGKYDCILMDINMPVMDGVEAVGLLKQRLGRTLPPVLALTADALPEHLDRFLAAGMIAYVVKPISEPLLLLRIGEATKRPDIIEHCRDLNTEAPAHGAGPLEELTGGQRKALTAFLSEMDAE